MTTQLLIYESVVTVSAARHAKHSYAHLHSMRYFELIRERMVTGKPAAEVEPATNESKAEKSSRPGSGKDTATGKKRQT